MGGYTIIAELPFEHVYIYAEWQKFRVFINGGMYCHCCGKVATKFYLIQRGDRKEWGLFTEDMVPLTVDHIEATNRGGADTIENKQPLCSGCNFIKSDHDLTLEQLRDKIRSMYSLICS